MALTVEWWFSVTLSPELAHSSKISIALLSSVQPEAFFQIEKAKRHPSPNKQEKKITHLDLFPIDPGALVPLGRVHQVEDREVHDPDDGATVDNEAHRDADVGVAVDKIHGAVDGVDDPGGVVRQVADGAVSSGSRLLADELVLRKLLSAGMIKTIAGGR